MLRDKSLSVLVTLLLAPAVALVASQASTLNSHAAGSVVGIQNPQGDPSIAVPDEVYVEGEGPFRVYVLANDVASLEGFEFDQSSVRFLLAGKPRGAVIRDDRRTLILPGRIRMTIDPVGGWVDIFTPPGYMGSLPSVNYEATDFAGVTAAAYVRLVITSTDDPRSPSPILSW